MAKDEREELRQRLEQEKAWHKEVQEEVCLMPVFYLWF